MPDSTPTRGDPSAPTRARRDRARRKRASRRWPLLAGLAWFAVIAAAGLTACAWLWNDNLTDVPNTLLAVHYAVFMAVTFVFHAGLAMLPVIAFAALTHRAKLALAALALFGLASGPELAALASRGAPSTDRAGTIAVMSVNLMYGRHDPARLAAVIRTHSPDVIVFQEWTTGAAGLHKADLLVEFPYAVESVRDDAFGQAVVSRRPFLRDPIIYPPLARGVTEPQITIEIEHDGKPLRITDIHTAPPVRPSYLAHQRLLASELALWCDRPDGPHVLAGDFNAVTRAPTVRVFTRAGYIDSLDAVGGLAGSWRGATWPRTGNLRHAPGIRLDHILHAPTLVCTEATVCEDIGSDHAPIIARLRWRDGAR
ncbi:MAG: endonuclease/exonuclease/phosphatase family protein [Phycisphaerales bacterium]|nr:endonuclease/exonuclease/phosphatase family protein [Phycisphaerales bacterium]